LTHGGCTLQALDSFFLAYTVLKDNGAHGYPVDVTFYLGAVLIKQFQCHLKIALDTRQKNVNAVHWRPPGDR
jgi:hypothetical protein